MGPTNVQSEKFQQMENIKTYQTNKKAEKCNTWTKKFNCEV